MRDDERLPTESAVAMAPTALFLFVLFALSARLATTCPRDKLDGLLFVLAVAWIPSLLIAWGTWTVHQRMRRHFDNRWISVIPGWLALVPLAGVAYVLAYILLSH